MAEIFGFALIGATLAARIPAGEAAHYRSHQAGSAGRAAVRNIPLASHRMTGRKRLRTTAITAAVQRNIIDQRTAGAAGPSTFTPNTENLMFFVDPACKKVTNVAGRAAMPIIAATIPRC